VIHRQRPIDHREIRSAAPLGGSSATALRWRNGTGLRTRGPLLRRTMPSARRQDREPPSGSEDQWLHPGLPRRHRTVDWAKPPESAPRMVASLRIPMRVSRKHASDQFELADRLGSARDASGCGGMVKLATRPMATGRSRSRRQSVWKSFLRRQQAGPPSVMMTSAPSCATRPPTLAID
jgi:hypothetical protein